MKSHEKKRFQNSFTVCNVDLNSIISDIFDKSATSIIYYLISEDFFDSEYCKSFLQRSLKKKADSVMHPLKAIRLPANKSFIWKLSVLILITSNLPLQRSILRLIQWWQNSKIWLLFCKPFPVLTVILPLRSFQKLVRIRSSSARPNGFAVGRV